MKDDLEFYSLKRSKSKEAKKFFSLKNKIVEFRSFIVSLIIFKKDGIYDKARSES